MSELVSGHPKGSQIIHDAAFVLPRLIALLANEIEYFYSHPTDSEERYLYLKLFSNVVLPYQSPVYGYYMPL
jgi:hypothetical protein